MAVAWSSAMRTQILPGDRAFWIRAGWLLVTALGFACAPPPQAAPVQSPKTSGATPSSAPPSETPAGPARCELVCGGASVARHEIPPDESADYYTNQAVERANETLNAMHDDLLACYEARVKASPKAHAFLTIGIVVGPDGHVQNVDTQGGALLGEPTMHCIVDRIHRGQFAPTPRGGTMRFEVPFTLRRVGVDEPI